MKMSDVFALPVKRVGNALADQCGYADGEDEASAAAHAINQHDALVEALENFVNNSSCQAEFPNACDFAEFVLMAENK